MLLAEEWLPGAMQIGQHRTVSGSNCTRATPSGGFGICQSNRGHQVNEHSLIHVDPRDWLEKQCGKEQKSLGVNAYDKDLAQSFILSLKMRQFQSI